MDELNLIQLDFKPTHLLKPLQLDIAKIIKKQVKIYYVNREISDCYNEKRQQYDAVKILNKFINEVENKKTIIFTSLDLCIPIFTYVFGLAKLGGFAAIVSSHRLRNEFYGLPANDRLLQTRLLKETIHEYGHLLELRHCNNYDCVMVSSMTVDDIDVKSAEFCKRCLAKMEKDWK